MPVWRRRRGEEIGFRLRVTIRTDQVGAVTVDPTDRAILGLLETASEDRAEGVATRRGTPRRPRHARHRRGDRAFTARHAHASRPTRRARPGSRAGYGAARSPAAIRHGAVTRRVRPQGADRTSVRRVLETRWRPAGIRDRWRGRAWTASRRRTRSERFGTLARVPRDFEVRDPVTTPPCQLIAAEGAEFRDRGETFSVIGRSRVPAAVVTSPAAGGRPLRCRSRRAARRR